MTTLHLGQDLYIRLDLPFYPQLQHLSPFIQNLKPIKIMRPLTLKTCLFQPSIILTDQARTTNTSYIQAHMLLQLFREGPLRQNVADSQPPAMPKQPKYFTKANRLVYLRKQIYNAVTNNTVCAFRLQGGIGDWREKEFDVRNSCLCSIPLSPLKHIRADIYSNSQSLRADFSSSLEYVKSSSAAEINDGFTL